MGRGVPKANTPNRPSKQLLSVTVRWEYTTIPIHEQRHFVCLSDRDEYAELAHQRGSTSAWLFPTLKTIRASDPRAFELQRFTVNGEPRPIRRSSRKDSQTYTVNIGSDTIRAGDPVTVAYTYRALMATDGNLLFFDIEQPTRDLRVDFDYQTCDFTKVSVLDLIPATRPSRIETPIAGTPETIRLDIDGWIFPRSGVAFVWTKAIEPTREPAPRQPKMPHNGLRVRSRAPPAQAND